ncbi:hypothetical protein BT63DRAFT_475435 [Microthyrium microscopicum]|uniref:Serine-threonine/tyrosine-protein kinase catalytic domain-containing protein n=1 Tax=Microthyrium microscopicum TaxID=703497 RepID=A0A6A6UKU2_9PEZI|nr:hypothetical protein BT63DRAFT_475435 [Microthyrium microscopicum]
MYPFLVSVGLELNQCKFQLYFHYCPERLSALLKLYSQSTGQQTVDLTRLPMPAKFLRTPKYWLLHRLAYRPSRQQQHYGKVHSHGLRFKRLNHPHLVEIVQTGCHLDWQFLISKFVSCHDLPNDLSKNDKDAIVSQCTSALQYLHNQGYAHTAINTRFILIHQTQPFQVKLGGLHHLIPVQTLLDIQRDWRDLSRTIRELQCQIERV